MSRSSAAGPIDPLKAWREWFVQSEREWSQALTRLMTDGSVARAVGQEINAALYGQQMIKQGMAGSLAMFNLPTQEHLAALGERLGRLEDAVARVEAGLVRLRDSTDSGAHAKPSRGRRAPAAAPQPRDAAENRPAAAPQPAPRKKLA